MQGLCVDLRCRGNADRIQEQEGAVGPITAREARAANFFQTPVPPPFCRCQSVNQVNSVGQTVSLIAAGAHA